VKALVENGGSLMASFNSSLISLADAVKEKLFFNIPIYQRLYVWGNEQVNTLLSDLWQAYTEKQEIFFLGGTLAIERQVDEEKVLDLIDGQQRFTTLWLASMQWGCELEDFCFDKSDVAKKHRISFSIRPAVTEYFYRKINGEEPGNIPQVSQMTAALEVISSFRSNLKPVPNDEEFAWFIKFINENVKLVLTTVPPDTDLNKLFEVINNRGAQLQHHEILKARLLQLIEVNDRERYSQIWEACSVMNDYVERSLKNACKVDVLSLYEKEESLAKADCVLRSLEKSSDEMQPMSLEAILKDSPLVNLKEKLSDLEEDEMPANVASIISFSMLLQHTLRIFLMRKERQDISKISDKHLIRIFEDSWLKRESSPPSSDVVKDFIKLLWEVRYQFDMWVVKWVFDEEEKYHSIRSIYIINPNKDKKNLQRNSEGTHLSLTLLQSMLYHSQEMVTQYWLTPFLNYLLNEPKDSVKPEIYLRHLDNHLLSSVSSDNKPMIARTRFFLENPWHEMELIQAEVALSQKFDNGVQYPHYWFYKLEYVLYLALKQENAQHEWIRDFRITAKNSVEHIAPQSLFSSNKEFPLHDFGNLALVSRSLNSELSNKSFVEKRAHFIDSHHKKGTSLKLEYVYQNECWAGEEIQKHQNDMIEKMQAYFDESTINEV
jgi:uncharacterized protein with ParB-like and HNH nuclease domain